MRPFQDTPLPEITRKADVIIIAAKTAAPSGVVRAYQREISMACAARARTEIKYPQKTRDSSRMVHAIQPPLFVSQAIPRRGHRGRKSAASRATIAPKTPR